jgi:GGDEF domain-containing protein
MQPGAPRRRPARPIPEAPIDALAADADRLAKGWLLAVIEQQPLSEAAGILAGEWAAEGPRVCESVVRALGSDEELERLRSRRFAAPGAVDPLRAVVWSALRAVWPDAEPDQVWDLGERLAVVVQALGGARATGAVWPDALEEAIIRARAGDEPLALVLVELVDADRMLAVEDADECAAVLARFGEAVRGAVGGGAGAVGGAGGERAVIDTGEGRCWVIAPGAPRERAPALASQIAAAVREAANWRGAPLAASAGVAVLGEDGDDAGALIAVAEEGMFAAAAAGIEIARGTGPERDPG